MKFFISKYKKLPRAVEKSLLPRKEFIAQGKERFLAAFDVSSLAAAHPAARQARTAMFFKLGIGAMAVFCVAVGVSVYADTANVPPTSPLYPLKRLDENIQLTLAPASEKAQLQATFAVRRANEIQTLQAANPSSTLIPKLTSDLNQEISSSLSINGADAGSTNGNNSSGAAIEAMSSETGPLSVYCKAFDMSTSSIFFGRLEENLVLHPKELLQFNKRCGSDSRGNASSSATASSSASIIRQGRNSKKDHGAGGVTTTVDISTADSKTISKIFSH